MAISVSNFKGFVSSTLLSEAEYQEQELAC